MHSARPKVLHALAGRPLLAHVLDAARTLKPHKIIVVHGHGGDEVRAAFPEPEIAGAQTEQLGTGHAVQQALPFRRHTVLVRAATPLVGPDVVRSSWRTRRTRACTPLRGLVPTPLRPRLRTRAARSIVEHNDASESNSAPDQHSVSSRLAGALACLER
jgi:bifunctional UDP-N-acetylglucosamine pyrophosphorylase/glucosamine-1-phosphate N-acetyltransferase